MSRIVPSWMIAHLAACAALSASGVVLAQAAAPDSSGTPAVAQTPTASFPLELAAATFVSPNPEAPAPPPTPAPMPMPASAPPPTPASAPAPPAYREPEQPAWGFSAAPSAEASPARDQGPPSEAEDFRDQWMVALSAATHAPVDLGIELAVETPIRLRLIAGLGYVPSGYLGVVTGALVGADALDDEARTLIEDGFESGRAWRLGVGIRPFKNFGAYLDGGFSQLSVSGSVDANEARELTGVRLATSYKVKSKLNAWFLELGYQGLIADRFLIAFGFGVMRATGARTTAEPTGTPSAAERLFDDAATATADESIEKYGIIPTLNLRLGFDVI